MRYTTSSGLTLAFDDTGEGPLVVLLHGLSGCRTTYGTVAAHLVDRGYRVVAVDQRGHGESDRAPLEHYDAPHYAADIAELLGELGGPALVAGHSLGGVVATHLAATRPDLVAALFCEDPPHFEGDDARRAASPVASFFPRLVAAVRALQAESAPPERYGDLVRVMVPPEEVDERCRTLSLWDPTTMQAAIDGIFWRGFDPVVPITQPYMILRSDPAAGAVFGPDDAPLVAAANPHVRIEMVTGAPHQIHSGPTLGAYLAALTNFCDTYAPK